MERNIMTLTAIHSKELGHRNPRIRGLRIIRVLLIHYNSTKKAKVEVQVILHPNRDRTVMGYRRRAMVHMTAPLKIHRHMLGHHIYLSTRLKAPSLHVATPAMLILAHTAKAPAQCNANCPTDKQMVMMIFPRRL